MPQHGVGTLLLCTEMMAYGYRKWNWVSEKSGVAGLLRSCACILETSASTGLFIEREEF